MALVSTASPEEGRARLRRDEEGGEERQQQ